MSASRWLLAAALAGACTLAAAGDPTPIGLKAGAFDPPQAAAEFPDGVRATDAGAARLARWRGKVVLLVFGFTHCPAVCPTTLATLAEARRLLGADAASLQVVYVTVDPERDDLAHVRAYLAGFDRSFVGATGEPQALALLRKRYGVTAQKVPAADGGADYAMSHSTSIYLIDRAGRLRALMPFGHSAADFAHDVRQLQALR
ncbi:MAG TPA: SCO family protein [Burkholderiaceae bacterium]|nr:SCO family protein [Burkholderiaceae bacterium]